MDRVAVLERVGPLVDGQIRHINDTHGTRVSVSGDTISLRPRRGAQLLDVAPEGAKAMVNLAGMPLKMAQNLSQGTFSSVLGELLEHVGSYSMVTKDNRIVDMIPYSTRPAINTERLLDVIEKTVPLFDYNQVDILPNRVVSIEVIGEKTQPVAKGEMVRAGVKVMFSPMGTIVPVVQSYAVVLACTNGMTSNNVLAEFHGGGGGGGGDAGGGSGGGGGGGGGGKRGEGDEIWQFFRQSLHSAYGSFEKVIEGYRVLRAENIKPGDRAALLEALLKQAKIGGKIAEAVRGMAIDNPPTNQWELANLITYASSHLLEAGPRQAAQRATAEFADADSHARTCPLCRRTR